MSDSDSLRPEDFEPHRVEADKSTSRATIGNVLRQNPLLRLVVLILPVVVVIFLIMSVFGGGKKAPVVSKVDGGSTVKDLSNSGSANEKYRQAVEEANKQKVEQAQATGKSVIVNAPPPVVTQAQTAITDPLAAFTTTPVAPPVKQPVQVAPPPPQQVTQPTKAVDPQLAQSYQKEMQAIIDSLRASKVTVTKVTANTEQFSAANANGGAQSSGTQSQAAANTGQTPVLIPAGTVIYGQTLTEADSDIPAPILVSVLSGPLQGGRAIGTFQKSDEYLILAFGTIIKDKKEYKVNAVAIDPETTLTGLETDVDHHYFQRFILPAAAGFVSGIGNYTQQAGSTVTYSTYGVNQSYPPLNTHQIILSGLGQSANAISNAVNKEADVPITIHVAGGTPIGIMFVNSVHEAPQ